MILLQLSAGQGPQECCKAVGLALQAIESQCIANRLKIDIIEAQKTEEAGCYKSVLLQLGDKEQQTTAKLFAQQWQGAMLWVCQSPYRIKHKRKNWFFSGQMFELNEASLDKEIKFQTCRASGAGGQHVNTTDSAVRATHVFSGISVRVQSERSQHANKRLARALIFHKLESAKLENMTKQEKDRWLQHKQVERGNPVRTFNGSKFSLVD
jgi:peptide chain release factor